MPKQVLSCLILIFKFNPEEQSGRLYLRRRITMVAPILTSMLDGNSCLAHFLAVCTALDMGNVERACCTNLHAQGTWQ